jgi:peroxiredoxin
MLNTGDAFPSLTVMPTAGDPIELPAAVAGRFAVVLLYRGAWCPYCKAQLRAFQRAADRFAEDDIAVIALSVDDAETTRATVAEHGLTFPVGYGADAQAVAAATGAFVNDDPRYLQSTGFVLGPDGRVLVAVYSTGAIGRLLPDDVLGMVRYARSQAEAAA